MRILCLGMYGLTGGGELSPEMRTINKIAELGHEVDYWTDAPLSYAMEPVLKQPATLRNFVFHEGKASLARTPRQLAPEDVGRIVREHSKKPYDIVFGTAHTGIDMGVWLKRCLNIPLVIQILDVPYWRIDPFGPWEIYRESIVPLPLLPRELFDGYAGEWRYWFNQLDYVDAVTTLVTPAKEAIIRYSGKDIASKTFVVHHMSLDQDTFDYYLRGEKVEKKNQVLCINRIDFHKGVDQAVLVCHYIQQMMGDDTPEFVFVSRGNQEWYEDLVKDLASKLLRKYQYRFTGWIDNVTKIRLLRESKVLIDCEWPEGFGGQCGEEALYCDTHFLCWDRRSKREVHPPATHFIPKNDYEGMARVAVDCLRDYKEVGSDAKEFIRQFRSHQSHATGLIEVFEKVIHTGV